MRPDLLAPRARDVADLGWRALLLVGAVVALLLPGPDPVAGGLVAAGLVAAIDALAERRRLGLADRVLVDVGGVLVTLVLTGLVLGSTPIGLNRTSWIVALTVVGAAGLAGAAVDRAVRRRSVTDEDDNRVRARRPALFAGLWLAPWLAAAVLVAVVSVRISSASLETAEQAPLAMSFGQVTGTRIEVVVSASDDVGPLEVRTSTDGNEISYPLFDVAADDPTTVTVSLPPTGRFVVTLHYPDQSQPLRSLVLDR